MGVAGSAPARTDLTNFIDAWNQAQGYSTPALHRRIAAWLADRWEARDTGLLLLAFRNAGKSTLVGLFCAWLLRADPSLRIMVLAADLALARKMVRNVKRIIERHPDCDDMKPVRADQWASEQFTVNRDTEHRDPSMLAKGIGANVTGSRADVVICDDVEVPRTSDTVGKREELRERLGEIDYVLVPGGVQLYIGTPHHYYSIYAAGPRPELEEDHAFLDGFARLELPLIGQDGSSVWPERFPADRIETIRRRTGARKFASQMLLQPTDIAEGRLDPDLLVPYDAEIQHREAQGTPVREIMGRELRSARCWWDPAFGAPGTGDANVIACLFQDADGGYWLHDVLYMTHEPGLTGEIDEVTQLCRKAAGFAKRHDLPQVIVETNGLGKFLPARLGQELAAVGATCRAEGRVSSRAKDLRILEAIETPLKARAIRAHARVLASPLITEMREWKPGGRGRDDGLDALAGCLLSDPVRLRRALHRPPPGWPAGAIHNADTDFKP